MIEDLIVSRVVSVECCWIYAIMIKGEFSQVWYKHGDEWLDNDLEISTQLISNTRQHERERRWCIENDSKSQRSKRGIQMYVVAQAATLPQSCLSFVCCGFSKHRSVDSFDWLPSLAWYQVWASTTSELDGFSRSSQRSSREDVISSRFRRRGLRNSRLSTCQQSHQYMKNSWDRLTHDRGTHSTRSCG